VRSALHPKAKACLAAIDGASRQGAYIVICESDLSTLVQALKMSEYDLSDFDEIIFVCLRVAYHVYHAIR
jgi:hypothetical protein